MSPVVRKADPAVQAASEYFAFAIWRFGISIEPMSLSLRPKRY
jgi:hypothetical protein